ncbi:L,D-transpeptidase [Rhizobium sp. SL86]|uniref:L,D-transpeptidase n=1 Tax=Rhizobium sp. SL86 TaxID=2995148 RepID=UPI0022763BF0|nr:L,D-transpeptidase family protein [Rhizobium sp. SL86]MCY1664561.1 L,D-transpeptidase family protein [Rhizobium sp. SL86]
MKKMLLITAGLLAAFTWPALANDRYRERPPVVVSPDLTAPWILQLGGQVQQAPAYRAPAQQGQVRVIYRNQMPAQGYQRQAYQPRYAPARQPLLAPRPQSTQIRPAQPVQAAAVRPAPVIRSQLEPQFLPQMVDYQTEQAPGTIVIDTNNRFLYLVMEGGKAKRYGVGVGKPGFEWAGEHKVTRKAEWPSWHPPKEMIEREAAKGHFLPVKMEGGPENPLGARALYLGSTLYRIHGTNAPWTIGSAVSSGCIRMRNEDVTDLYGRVNVGTKVIVM